VCLRPDTPTDMVFTFILKFFQSHSSTRAPTSNSSRRPSPFSRSVVPQFNYRHSSDERRLQKDFGDPPPVEKGDEAQEDPTPPEADQPADNQAEVDPTGVGKALRRSVLPGQLSKRALVCANGGGGGVLTPIINAVATALK